MSLGSARESVKVEGGGVVEAVDACNLLSFFDIVKSMRIIEKRKRCLVLEVLTVRIGEDASSNKVVLKSVDQATITVISSNPLGHGRGCGTALSESTRII